MEINEAAFTELPQLESERLLMRQMQKADHATLYEMRSDPEMMRYIGRPLMQHEADLADLLAVIEQEYENRTGLQWIICLREKNQMVGNIMIRNISREHFFAELGYMLHSDYWRQGIMYEAAVSMITYVFRELGLHSLYARIDPANTASARLLEKLGFRQSARMRENFYFNGEFTDTVIFDLLAREWKRA